MLLVKTKSGSEYLVSGNRIMRKVRSKLSESERVGPEWREAVEITQPTVGKCITIYWGDGIDAQSPEGTEPIGNNRLTHTTEVVSVQEVDYE